MARIRFTEPDLQAVYACLNPQEVDGRADTAEAIAAREGLDLSADLAAVRDARPAPPHHGRARSARPDAGRGRRSLESLVGLWPEEVRG